MTSAAVECGGSTLKGNVNRKSSSLVLNIMLSNAFKCLSTMAAVLCCVSVASDGEGTT